MKHPIRYRLEAALVWVLFAVFRVLPLDWSSSLGGLLGRIFGALSGKTRLARRQMAAALPEIPPDRIAGMVTAMWDNFGRTVAELTQLRKFSRDGVFEDRVEVVGVEHVAPLVDDDKGALLFTGHFGNWELLPVFTSRKSGCLSMSSIERPTTRFVDRMIVANRSDVVLSHIPKGADGARLLIRALRQKQHVGTFVDQRMNDGIPVPFFGRPAMTAVAIAQLAVSMKLPIVGGCVERLGGARFRITVTPPLQWTSSGDRDADALALMTEINRIVETWVRRRPDQWLWIHRRWGKNGMG